MRLEDKVIVVTGSGQGIGEGYARGLVAEGAKVAVADINVGNAEDVAKSLGDNAAAFRVDVADEQSCNELMASVAEHFGGIDGLVNNAATFFGIKMSLGWMDIEMDYWQRILDNNLTSVLLCTRAVVPHLEQRGGGTIVNQASIAAFYPGNFYSLTKRAVLSMTAGLAKELGERGIHVYAISPGPINTEAMLTQSDGMGAAIVDQMAETAQVFHRRGTPEDLVGPLVFLLSPDSDWMTGQNLIVDGGTIIPV